MKENHENKNKIEIKKEGDKVHEENLSLNLNIEINFFSSIYIKEIKYIFN